MKDFWADWKAKGKPPIVRGCIRVGVPKSAAAATQTAWRRLPELTPEQKRAALIAYLKERFPHRNWDDLKAPD
jgi:hypothetical protein